MRIIQPLAAFALATALLTTSNQWALAEILRSEWHADSEGIRPNVIYYGEYKNLWGYIDRTGKLVIPPRFDMAWGFVSGLAAAKLNDKEVVIDRSGNVTTKGLPSNYCCDDAVIPFHKDIYDESGKKLIAPGAKGIEVHRFYQGLAAFHLPVELGVHFYEQFFHGEDAWAKKDGTYGYINEQGRIVIAPRFTKVFKFQDGIAIIEEGTNKGYIDLTGKLIGGKMHEWRVNPFSDGVGIIEERTTKTFIDKNGKILASGFEDAGNFTEGLAPVKQGSQWSLIDKTGKTVRKLNYDRVESSREGLSVVHKDGKTGFMNAAGDLVIPLQFDDARYFEGGLAAVAINPSDAATLKAALDAQKWQCTYINRNGQIVIKGKFDGAKIFKEGLAPVLSGLKWGYIDHTGVFKIKPQFDEADLFSEGYAAVRVNKKWGYITKDGKFAIQPKFAREAHTNSNHAEAGRFVSGVAIVDFPKTSRGLINKSGQRILSNLDVDTNEKQAVSDGLILVASKDNSWIKSYFNTAGKLIVKSPGVNQKPFTGGYAKFETESKSGNGKIGFINKLGKIVVQPTWDNAGKFSESLVAISHGSYVGKGNYEGKWGFIDVNGKYVCGLKFDAADDFSEGLAAVKVGDRWGYIDRHGAAVTAPEYDGAESFSDGRGLIRYKLKYGFVDKNGKKVIPAKYEYASKFSEGLAVISVPKVASPRKSKP